MVGIRLSAGHENMTFNTTSTKHCPILYTQPSTLYVFYFTLLLGPRIKFLDTPVSQVCYGTYATILLFTMIHVAYLLPGIALCISQHIVTHF